MQHSSQDADEIVVPEGRDRLGRAHQLRVDIAVAISLVPVWLKRALVDRNDARARGARNEMVERIAIAIEKRFGLSWHGSSDEGENALPLDSGVPLVGGAKPGGAIFASTTQIPAQLAGIDLVEFEAEHKANNRVVPSP